MDDYLKEALEILKAQASVRTMSEEEMLSMVKSLSQGIQSIAGTGGVVEEEAEVVLDPKKAIKEKSIQCLECGKAFKILTKKHLGTHALTPDEYRAKWGYPKRSALVCKSLQRERRKKRKDRTLWEKRTGRKKG